jgi:hypothetical protein
MLIPCTYTFSKLFLILLLLNKFVSHNYFTFIFSATGFDKKVGYNPELHDYELIENTKFRALIEENRKRKAPILESSPQIFVARHQQPHPLPPRDNSNHDITDYKYYFPINSDGVFDLVSSDDDDDNKSDEERDRILKVTWMSELAGSPDWLRVFNSRVGDDLYFIIEQSDNNNIISDVHIIEDYKKGQVYIIKTLTANHHFQLLLPSITGYLDRLKSSTRIKFYPNNGNHMNDFCVVLNEHKSTAPILDLIDFDCVDDRLDNLSSDKAGGATRQAQHTRESFGSATSQCMSRNSSGATYPKLLKGTEDPFVKRIFVALSMIFKIDSIPDWAKYVSIPPFQEHAKKIDEKNEIDACTLHKSGRKNLLQDHVDANNPNSTAANKRSVVVGASKWVNNNRVGATGYLRRSICESIKREKVMLPLLLQLKSAYLAFAENRRQWNFDIFKKSALMGNVIDRDHFSVACNINPLGFHSLWIHCVCILIYSYQLSYPAVISVLSCKDVMPNTAYFFSLAVYELVLGKVEFSGDPILLGRCISIRMIQHRDEYYARMGTTKKSILRYASYNKKSVADIPSELEWYQQVMQKTAVFLFISSTYNKRPNLSNIDRIHNVLSAMVQDCTSGVGPLGALHSICILSKFGILPYWTGTYGCLQGRVLKRIQEKFPKITFVGNAGRSTMTAIITFLHSELGIKWSYNELENFFCKFDRITTGPSRRSSDSFFFDCHHHDEIIISNSDDGLTVTMANGSVIEINSNTLCTTWELANGSLMTPAEIFVHLGLGVGNASPNVEELCTTNITTTLSQSFPIHQNKSSLLFSFENKK